jgi:hypothetical protein
MGGTTLFHLEGHFFLPNHLGNDALMDQLHEIESNDLVEIDVWHRDEEEVISESD